MRGKPENEVLNTTVHRQYSTLQYTTNTQTLYLFLLHMYSYYSTFIVAILLDMTSQMLFCTLPIASIVSKYSHASEFVSIRVYCSLCIMYPVLKSIVQCTLLCMHSTVFSKKITILIVYITEFSLKIEGG